MSTDVATCFGMSTALDLVIASACVQPLTCDVSDTASLEDSLSLRYVSNEGERSHENVPLGARTEEETLSSSDTAPATSSGIQVRCMTGDMTSDEPTTVRGPLRWEHFCNSCSTAGTLPSLEHESTTASRSCSGMLHVADVSAARVISLMRHIKSLMFA